MGWPLQMSDFAKLVVTTFARVDPGLVFGFYMILFLRSFLWSLAAALAVGLVVSVLDAPTVLAQGGEEFEFETGEGTEIQDDPHLYWKCWRTDMPTGSGFTNGDISV